MQLNISITFKENLKNVYRPYRLNELWFRWYKTCNCDKTLGDANSVNTFLLLHDLLSYRHNFHEKKNLQNFKHSFYLIFYAFIHWNVFFQNFATFDNVTVNITVR